LVAMIVGAVVFYGHAGLGDNTIEAEHRIAIRAGIEKFHLVQAGGDIDPAALLLLEQFSGVKKLKWETEPEPEQIGRELQSVLDDNGRILGWLSWDAERPMTAAAARFLPLFVGISFSLIALAFLFLWHARRIAEELAGIEQRMRELAHQDPLTGLPNGPRTMQFLEQALATRAADEIVTCCYLDLAGFRELSDSIGLPWCNELVRVIALKLGEVLPPEATIGRLGRHRFVFVSRTGSPEAGFSLAQEASKAISNPLWIHGQVAQIGANIGVAHAPRDGLTSDELFRHATLAMRAAKRAGRGTMPGRFGPRLRLAMGGHAGADGAAQSVPTPTVLGDAHLGAAVGWKGADQIAVMMQTGQGGTESVGREADIFGEVFLGRLSTAQTESLQGASAVMHSVISLGSASRVKFRVLASRPGWCKWLTDMRPILL